jgi:cyclophilin family peptidyl-prolyl cis-trans isomerase
MKGFLFTAFFAAAIGMFGCSTQATTSDTGESTPTAKDTSGSTPAPTPSEPAKVTPVGTITLELYPDKAPKTCAQILGLIDSGFYNGQRVHRVESWVIQWGDPQSKADNWQSLPVGTQGAGKPLPFESTDVKMEDGTLAMASTGAKVGGDSQMFILYNCPPQQAEYLQGKYCAFGKVTGGMDLVKQVRSGDKMTMKKVGEQKGDGPVKVELMLEREG